MDIIGNDFLYITVVVIIIIIIIIMAKFISLRPFDWEDHHLSLVGEPVMSLFKVSYPRRSIWDCIYRGSA